MDRQVAKLESKLALNAVSADRLSDDYLDRFVFLPLDELVGVRRRQYIFSKAFLKFQHEKERVGEVKPAGVIGNEEAGTVALSAKDLADAQYAYAEAKDGKLKKLSEINEERAKNLSERDEALRSVALIHNLIAMRTVLSPIEGIIEFRCVVGQFVDKGDVVAEIN